MYKNAATMRGCRNVELSVEHVEKSQLKVPERIRHRENGDGVVREEGWRGKGTIKISAIQSLAGNSRAWHLYY